MKLVIHEPVLKPCDECKQAGKEKKSEKQTISDTLIHGTVSPRPSEFRSALGWQALKRARILPEFKRPQAEDP
jgi:hypothetical protein